MVNKGDGKIAATVTARDYGDITDFYFASEKQLSTVDSKLSTHLTNRKSNLKSDLDGYQSDAVAVQRVVDSNNNDAARDANEIIDNQEKTTW